MLLPHSNVQLGLDQCTPKQLERIAKNIAHGVKPMWRQLSHETKKPTK